MWFVGGIYGFQSTIIQEKPMIAILASAILTGTKATTSDGLAIWDEQAISVHADSDSEILLFDLPPV